MAVQRLVERADLAIHKDFSCVPVVGSCSPLLTVFRDSGSKFEVFGVEEAIVQGPGPPGTNLR